MEGYLDLIAWFSGLTCTMKCGTMYTQVCAIGELQSSQKDNQSKRDAPELNLEGF